MANRPFRRSPNNQRAMDQAARESADPSYLSPPPSPEEDAAVLDETQSPVNPVRDFINDAAPPPPDVVDMGPPSEELSEVEDVAPPVADVADIADLPTEPTIEDQERQAYTDYDRALMEGRRASSQSRFGADLQYAGELLNQAFAGGPKAKPIDPFFKWLRDDAGIPEAQAEKDADRRLRMDLQRLKSLRKDKEADSPDSPANRAYQQTVRQMWIDAGLDPAVLPLLTQKQIDSGLKSRDLVGKTTGRIASQNLRERQFDLKKIDQEYDQLVGKTKLRMAAAKNEQDRQKFGLQNMKDYTVKVNKEIGEMPRALEQVLQAVKVAGVPVEKGFDGLAGRLLNKIGRGVDARWQLNNPVERKLYQSIQEVANAVIRSRAGMAVSAQEAERLNRALGLGEFGTIADTLVAFEDLRERLGELTRSYEEGFRPSIPDNIWYGSPNVISTSHPVFKDLYPEYQSSGLQGLNIEEPELGITAPQAEPAKPPPTVPDVTRSAPTAQDITRKLGEPKRRPPKNLKVRNKKTGTVKVLPEKDAQRFLNDSRFELVQ